MVLTGVGLGGGASLLGLGEYAAVVGALVAIAGCLFVGITTNVWNISVVRRWTSGGAFDRYDLLTRGLFRAVSAAFFGVGLLIGSDTSASPVLLIRGVAGLTVLALMREQRATSQRP